MRGLICQIVHSNFVPDPASVTGPRTNGGKSVSFTAPRELCVTPTALRRVLVTGSCQVEFLARLIPEFPEGCPVDFVLTNTGDLPPVPPQPLDQYDFQILQMPMRFLLREGAFMRLSHADEDAFSRLFTETVDAMQNWLDRALSYNRSNGLLSFIFNFLVPQNNATGRLQYRYRYSNPVFFFEELNRALADRIEPMNGVHVIDVAGLAANVGKRSCQDDSIATYLHSSILTSLESEEEERLVSPEATVRSHFNAEPARLIEAEWDEIVACYRTIRRVDQVKMVIVDLDDTLWRGIAAEAPAMDILMVDGWPLGFLEALSYLRRRGILLGIISKNDEARTRANWASIYGPIFPIDEFAAVRVNWLPKAENMAAILRAVNILPSSVVFVDDSPVERAAMEAAFPGIRTLGSTPYYFRQVMLLAAETQVAAITPESHQRTAMVQAQVAREETRERLPPPDFLRSLRIDIQPARLEKADDPRLGRVEELINRTNQFNTTGQRWTTNGLVGFLADGGSIHTFTIQDKFTCYGLTAVLLTQDSHIVQFVMSCRVAGLGVEQAVVARFIVERRRAGGVITAALTDTGRNGPVHDLWRKCHFQPADAAAGHWRLPGAEQLLAPGHVTVLAPAEREP